MALARRGTQRFSGNVWPGFVDAMGALLMVLIFVLSIFMILQSVMRDALTTKDAELSDMGAQIAALSNVLALEQTKTGELTAQLGAQNARISALGAQLAARQGELDSARQKLTEFEAQVVSLLAERDAVQETVRLDRAMIDELRAKLQSSGDEVAAMTLQLEEARRKAEETLTLLAAANTARADLEARLGSELTEAEKMAALKATADTALAEQTRISDEAARKVALMNEQIAALNRQMQELQAILDAAQARDTAAKVQVEALGGQLNSALAQVAAEQKRRAELEEAARRKAEAEKEDLAKYRSEFFGRMSNLLAGRAGVRVVGDRFVFSSEVLFEAGSADLSPEGQAQIARVADTFRALSGEIPLEIDWILEVDGFTDDTPLSGQGLFRDNWELSQARALSVVRYMISGLGFPPNRLAAAGFGEFRPVAPGNSPEARAANRRIELKLTER